MTEFTGDVSALGDTPEIDAATFVRRFHSHLTEHLSRRPGLRLALSEDARKFEAHRMERVYDAGPRLLLDMLRLMWVSEDYLGLVLYRLRTALSRAHVPIVPQLINKLCMTVFGIRIGNYAVLREAVYLPHGNVVIDGAVYVGRSCEICPGVTLGLIQGVGIGPALEDGVYVGTGARVLGPVRIGEGARIGAGAVVLRDVPAFATVVGVPARVVDDDWRLATSDRWAVERLRSIIAPELGRKQSL